MSAPKTGYSLFENSPTSDSTNFRRPSAIKISVQRAVDGSRIGRFSRKFAVFEDSNVSGAKRTHRDAQTNLLNDTPPSRKSTRSLQVRNISRRNSSTDVLGTKSKEEGKEPVNETSPIYSLPTIELKDSTMAFRRLEAGTLASLLRNLTEEEFLARFVLVDCRYPYEFNGGHIQNAVNLYDQKNCDAFFFREKFDTSRIPIFYCEYSQKRGPTMATLLRSHDRCRNVDQYPNVTFNEIYVLDGGYRGFFDYAKERQAQFLCSPFDYIEMDDSRFGMELRQFTFHRKYTRASVGIRNEPRKGQTKHRPALFKSKSSPEVFFPEKRPSFPDLKPTRLDFSLFSPEPSFL